MNRLEDRVALVTGAANGIGRAIAERYAAEGATVVGLDLSAMGEPSGCAAMMYGDVGDESVLRTAIEDVVSLYGRLDVMVNNAALQIEKSFSATTDADLNRMLSTNVRAVFNGCRLAAAAMVPRKSGAIINLGSVLSFTADPVLSGYATTKGAVAQITRNAAIAYARDGVRVNAICPGAVLTPLTTRVWDMAEDPAAARAAMESVYPLGRIALPEEIAGPAVFLASDDASAVIGALLLVDCGLTATNAEYSLTSALARG